MRRAAVVRYGWWVALPLGLLAILVVSGAIVGVVARMFGLNETPAVVAGLGVALYVLAFTLVQLAERGLFGHVVTKKELGIDHSITWKELGLGVAGFIVFLVASMIVTVLAKAMLPMIDWNQAQNVGFSTNIYGVDRMLAFLLLVVMAPIAEELLFRGYLFGKLQKAHMPVWLAVIAVSVVFAVMHGQVNVGIVVFLLSVVACGLRYYTKSIWPGAIVHGLNNLLTFYVTFVWALHS